MSFKLNYNFNTLDISTPGFVPDGPNQYKQDPLADKTD